MTTRQLQELLLTHYLFAKEMCKGLTLDEALNVCDLMSVAYGVCLCASSVFNEQIYWKEWVEKYCKGMVWGATPESAYSLPSLLSALQIRIDNLQKEISL